MSEQYQFNGKVAVVTGSGGGLGRAYAKLLAARGAKVVVNDLGGSVRGEGGDSRAADLVVDEIMEAGGTAVANYDSVTEGEKVIETALDAFGRVDILINNAGILRDRSFAKMSEDDWQAVYNVHLFGSFKTARAAWPHMRQQNFGRIIFVCSTSGIYGNFGQANYSAMKLALFGFSNTLAIEGAKRNIHSNAIAPTAGSRMTEGLMPKQITDALRPDLVAPFVAYLCHETCDVTGSLFEVGGGWAAQTRWQRTQGATFSNTGYSIEDVAQNWEKITDWTDAQNPSYGETVFAPMMQNLGI